VFDEHNLCSEFAPDSEYEALRCFALGDGDPAASACARAGASSVPSLRDDQCKHVVPDEQDAVKTQGQALAGVERGQQVGTPGKGRHRG
jgi:hypothetical protein